MEGSVSGGQWSVPTAQGSATGNVRCCNFPVCIVMEGLVLCRRITPPTDLRLVHEDLCLLYKGIGEADIEGTPRDAGTLLCTMERGSEGDGRRCADPDSER